MKNILRTLLGLSLTALTACATYQQAEQTVWIAPDISVPLPEQNCENPVNVRQLLRFSYGNKSDRLLTQLRCEADRLELIGMLPVGTRLFTLTREGGVVRVEMNIPIADKIKPEQVLWDILFSQLTSDAFKAVLPAGYAVKTSDKEKILVNDKGSPIERIVYSTDGKPLSIENAAFGYRIQIRNLE